MAKSSIRPLDVNSGLGGHNHRVGTLAAAGTAGADADVVGAAGAGAGAGGHGRAQRYLNARVTWAACAAFSAFVVAGLVIRLPATPGLSIAAAVVAIAAAVTMAAAAQVFPLLLASIAVAGVAVLGHATSSNVGWFALVVLCAWLLLAGTRRQGVILWVGLIALFVAEWVWAERDPGWAAWVGGVTFSAVAALVQRHVLDLVVQLRSAQAQLADHVRSEERARIARELHDIIAHSLTVSLLHIGSARLATAGQDPEDAADALAEAERLCRASLDEVRSAVGLLRNDSGPGAPGDGLAAPLPGMVDVLSLLETFERAGAGVRHSFTGDPDAVSATAGLAVYRIVQESLTNAVKHAPGASIVVDVAIDEADVRVRVESAGDPGQGTGHGLVNMRERAALLGGRCSAGPGGCGWLVEAVVPRGADTRRTAIR